MILKRIIAITLVFFLLFFIGFNLIGLSGR